MYLSQYRRWYLCRVIERADPPPPLPCSSSRVSVVGVAAEVHVCRRMADDTGGTYAVALGGSHLEELMLTHAPPPPASAASAGAQLVRGGGGPVWVTGCGTGGASASLDESLPPTLVSWGFGWRTAPLLLVCTAGIWIHVMGRSTLHFSVLLFCLPPFLPAPPVCCRSHPSTPIPCDAQVRMGFPQRNAEGQSAAVYVSAAARLAAGGYTCPRCKVGKFGGLEV